MSDKWTDRLSEYLDGDLDAVERVALEAHLPGCAECSTVLAELRAVTSRAHALDDRPPSHDLWPGVAALIGAGPQVAAQKPEPRGKVLMFRRFTFSVPQLAAAALALMIGSGAAVYTFAGRQSAQVATMDPGSE